MPVKMKLSPAALCWLGSAFDEKTKLSPFSNLAADGLTAEDQQGLVSQGIIDGANALNPEAYALMECLAKAKAHANVRLSGSFGQVDRTAYFWGDRIVTADYARDHFIIDAGGGTEGITEIISEIAGNSRLVNSNLNARMGIKSAIAFAALLDLTRRHAMTQYAEAGVMPDGFTVSDILTMLERADKHRWLTWFLKTLRLPGASLDRAEVEEALSHLESSPWVLKTGAGYFLTGEALELASNFLVVENILHLRSGQEDDQGRILGAECVFLQAGLHDVLMLDISADAVEFNAISTAAMLDYVRKVMTSAPVFV